MAQRAAGVRCSNPSAVGFLLESLSAIELRIELVVNSGMHFTQPLQLRKLPVRRSDLLGKFLLCPGAQMNALLGQSFLADLPAGPLSQIGLDFGIECLRSRILLGFRRLFGIKPLQWRLSSSSWRPRRLGLWRRCLPIARVSSKRLRLHHDTLGYGSNRNVKGIAGSRAWLHFEGFARGCTRRFGEL